MESVSNYDLSFVSNRKPKIHSNKISNSNAVNLTLINTHPPEIVDKEAQTFVYPLYQNLNLYSITTTQPQIYTQQPQTYIPLTVAFEVSPKYNYLYLNPLKDILKYLISYYLYISVDLVEYTIEIVRDDIIVIYTPTYKGNAIWVNRNHLSNILNKINLKQYYRYEFISGNALSWYAINKYHKMYEQFNFEQFLENKTGIYIKTEVPDQFENTDVIPTLRAMILKYQNNGYFTPKHKLSDSLIHAYMELAEVWQGQVINSFNPMVIKSKIKPFEGIEAWYRTNAIRLLNQKLARYTLILDSKHKKNIKEAYKLLQANYPVLKHQKYKIGSLGDKIQFKAQFIGDDQVKEFKLILNGIKPEMSVNEKCAQSSSCMTKNRHSKRASEGPKGRFVYKRIMKELSKKERIETEETDIKEITKISETAFYDIYLEIATKDLVKYKHYDSFLNLKSLDLKHEYEYLFYQSIQTSDIDQLIEELNWGWQRYELISDWGFGFYDLTGIMSRFCLKKEF